MAIIDANHLSDQTRLRAEICIIGAGAAGITLAVELGKASHDVCLIESGSYNASEENQALYDLESVGYPVRENFMSRARYFGGSCNLCAGRTMKLGPIDLLERPWVPYSGWPISYEELEQYYPRAERVLRLPAFEAFEFREGLPGGSQDEAALFAASQLEPTVALWARKPLRFGKAFKRDLLRSANVRTYINGNAVELIADASGRRIRKLVVKTLGGRQLSAEADHYVIACGGLESARLMLVSRSQHTNGLGNENDLVGRFFQDHPRAIFGRVRLTRPLSLPYVLGMPISDGKVQLGLRLSDDAQRREGLLNSYVSLEPQLSELAEQQYQKAVHVAKVLLKRGYAGDRSDILRGGFTEFRDMVYLLTPKEIMPHSVYRLYAWLKRRIRRTVSASHLTIINYCEQAPDPQSRIYLADDRDALGMRSLVLDWRIGDEERRSIKTLHEELGAAVVKAGIGALETNLEDFANLRFTDASHHIGTLRMSASPKVGVVDENCGVHGVDNLFAAGSAVFPTAGHANPTLTITALALRLADHLRKLQQATV